MRSGSHQLVHSSDSRRTSSSTAKVKTRGCSAPFVTTVPSEPFSRSAVAIRFTGSQWRGTFTAMSQPPAAERQVVPMKKPSPGQLAPLPVQVSALSQTPAAERQTVPEATKPFVGHVPLAPVQVSCTSQRPAAGRQTAPALLRVQFELQQDVDKVRLDDSLLDYLLSIVERTRHSEFLALGVSTRGAAALSRAAKALAFSRERHYCIPDDIKELVSIVLPHRVTLKSGQGLRGPQLGQAEQVIRDIVESVPVPL